MRRYDGAVLVGECRFRNGPNLKIRRERGVTLLMAVVEGEGEGEDVDVAVGLWLDAQGGADDAAHTQPVVDDGRHSVLQGEEDTGRLRARRGGTRLEPNGSTGKSMLIQSKATDGGLLPEGLVPPTERVDGMPPSKRSRSSSSSSSPSSSHDPSVARSV
ncbi:hypothetical protein X797_004302 [Metarhizium robertsii]|uniref:Amine oxidase n=2 Tax=Metarhizium robertsii TaxID=568076 RepID=A0A0B2XHB3_METRA|nr:amine oxidase [Metarhizium robertsii ARSEF 23]EXV02173.1 hypothetical protein X797_004302 [Metarhizium robertsii]KHO11296.1 amine oxidase [Metarhizium robertsii ARSEF 23]